MSRIATTVLLALVVGGCANSPSRVSLGSDVELATTETALKVCQFNGREDLGRPAPTASISEVCRTEDLKDVERLAQFLPRASTLVVFDIDDTVLTATAERPHERFFGSDRWFRWQMDLPNDNREKIRCLLEDVLPLDYEAARLRPTQPDAAKIVNRIPNERMFLTSRSPNYRGGTERELRHVGVAPLGLILGKEPALLEFVDKDTRRPMSYANGIYMTSGADKGRALIQLLGDVRSYKTVILVDDGGKNIGKMKDALAQENIDYYGLRYDRIKLDPYPVPLPPVSEAQIDESRAAMKRWLAFMRDLYPERYEELTRTCGNFTLDDPTY